MSELEQGPASGTPEPTALVSLRHDPYRLLLEMERRARQARLGPGEDGAPDLEWNGIAFRVGDLRLLTPREEIMEVLMPPEVTRVPGAQPWLRGITQLRGQLIPLTDLRAYLFDAPVPPGLSGTRVLVASHRQIPAGLIVDEVYGFRRIPHTRRRRVELDGLAPRIRPCVEGGFLVDDEVWPAVRLHTLIESDKFLDPAV